MVMTISSAHEVVTEDKMWSVVKYYEVRCRRSIKECAVRKAIYMNEVRIWALHELLIDFWFDYTRT